MSVLHPPQTPVPVVVFTPSGWIQGIFHVPKVKNVLGFLNAQEEVLRLTDVLLPGSTQVQPFVALLKSATLLVIPQAGESKPENPARDQRQVTCLLSLGSIRGFLDVADTVRTSDYFLRSPSFIELHQCHIGPHPFVDPDTLEGDPLPTVYVNAKAMVGATEFIAPS